MMQHPYTEILQQWLQRRKLKGGVFDNGPGVILCGDCGFHGVDDSCTWVWFNYPKSGITQLFGVMADGAVVEFEFGDSIDEIAEEGAEVFNTGDPDALIAFLDKVVEKEGIEF